MADYCIFYIHLSLAAMGVSKRASVSERTFASCHRVTAREETYSSSCGIQLLERARMRLAVAVVLLCSAVSGADDPTLKAFQDRVEAYVKLRKQVADSAPPVKKNATPEEIHQHELALAAAIRKARAGARQGDILASDIEPVFNRVLKTTLAPGNNGKKLRASIKEGNPKNERAPGEVQPVIAVNAVYPTNAPLSTVPPSLLLRLPKLPTDLEYRFVGRTLVLRDREANMIIDFLKEAVPAT